MSPVHKLSQMGSLTTNKTDYPSMLAGYGDFGALTRIAYQLNGSTTNPQFTNIPQTFQDLRIVISARKASGSFDSFLGINSDFTGNTASRTLLNGDGSSATSSRRTGDSVIYFPVATSATVFSTITIDILNYRSSTFKTVIIRGAADQNGSGYTYLQVGLKQLTSAITTLDVNGNDAGYVAGSTFALYGVKASAA